MRVHAQQAAQDQQQAFRSYVQNVAGGRTAADELSGLAELRSQGVITDEEFQRLKERVIQGSDV
jgi:hypothetical protein